MEPISRRLIPRPPRHRLPTRISRELIKQLIKIGVNGLIATKRVLKLVERVKVKGRRVKVTPGELLVAERGVAE